MDLWQNAARMFGPDPWKESDTPTPDEAAGPGEDKDKEDEKDTTETRRLEHPPGSIVGVNKPDLARRILEFKDERFYVLVGEVSAFLRNGGLVIFTTVGEALPVATVLLGTAAGLLAAGEEPLIIVDVEYPYHGVCTLLQMEGLPGLSELLAGRGGPSDLIFTCRDPIAAFVCPGRTVPPVWDLVGIRMQDILKLLKDVFGRVLMLGPPLGQGTSVSIAAAAEAANIPVGLVPVHPAGLEDAGILRMLDSLPQDVTLLGRVLV